MTDQDETSGSLSRGARQPAAQGGAGFGDPRRFTAARIGLRRTGVSLATGEALAFAEAHALARDAVHATLPVAALLASLRERGYEALTAQSAAGDRAEYLRRPDLGRRLSDDSEKRLADHDRAPAEDGCTRLAVVLADGLSALAAERHAVPLLDRLCAELGCGPRALSGGPAGREWALAPIVIAEQARVALGDAVGQTLRADGVVVLIGERPGLSSPDSLGAYITWRPRADTSDAERNCVSNIRREGLDHETASQAIAWYCREARRLNRSGVGLHAAEDTARLGPGTHPAVSPLDLGEAVRPTGGS